MPIKVCVYVKCHKPEDGEMRLCIEQNAKSLEVAQRIIEIEKSRFRRPKYAHLAPYRRWEIE